MPSIREMVRWCAVLTVLSLSGVADAQTKYSSPADEVLLREVVLGYCAEQVLGKPLIEHAFDETSWKAAINPTTTNGLKLFAPRVSPSNLVMMDLAPNKVSCWVQGAELASTDIAESLRSELKLRSGALVFDEKTEGGAHSTILGIVSEGSNIVPMFSIVDYSAPAPGILTVVVTTGTKG